MHSFKDAPPNPYSPFMCKYASMCKMCIYVHIFAKYVLKLKFYAIAVLQMHK